MNNEKNNRKIENAFFVSVLLFVFKIIFPLPDTFLLMFANEALILLNIYFWFKYVADFIEPQLNKPLSLVINAGLLTALLFFIMSAFEKFYNNPKDSSGLFYILFTSLISFVFIGSLAYIFAVYKKLCFYRQKKSPKIYFNILVVLFVTVALFQSFSTFRGTHSNGFRIYDLIETLFAAFFTSAMILIFINSLRVAWIAFLSKKQKTKLLLISFFMIIISWINFGILTDEQFKIVHLYSPALEYFLAMVMAYGGIYFVVIFFTTLFHLPTAEAIDRKTEELSSFKGISMMMSQVFDSEELYETITSTILKVSNSDASWLLIKTGKGFNIHSAKGITINEAETFSNYLLKNQIISTEKIQILSNAQAYVENISLQNISAIVSAPLSTHNTNKGFLFAARKSSYNFEEEELNSINTFANFAAIALENSKLLEESIEKERLEKELDVARDVQYKLLPQITPKYNNLDIAALFVPAFEVGGDYYDFFEISKNKLGVVIADVSGKGIEAAFVMAEVKGVFASFTNLNLTAKELLVKVNSVLYKSLPKKIFVTVTYGIVDITDGTFNFSRAGHSPLIFSSSNGIEKLIPAGIGLGLTKNEKFGSLLKNMEIKLNNNDIIILFTDGINETVNEHLEEFGYERLEKIIEENKNLPADQIVKKIMFSVSTFSQNRLQHDDITLVILKWKNKNKTTEVN